MNTEQKAKAYDKALETARQIHNGNPSSGTAIVVCEQIFPELEESEDERIRKALIWHLKAGEDFVSNGVTKAECLAYLEKQKDASKAIEAVDRIDKYIDERLANAHDMKDSNPDKKYYRGWDDALGKMAGILQDVYSGEKQKEPKPAEWSDTDNIGWGEAFACVTRAEKAAKNEKELQNAVTAEEWLKEIKFKYYVHPVKQEWSKEDKETIDLTIAVLKENLPNGYFKTNPANTLNMGAIHTDELINRLKSLRPVSKESINCDKEIVL